MTIKVQGMSCQHCEMSVKKLTKEFAKGPVEVDLQGGSVIFEPKEDFDRALYAKALEDIGFDAK